jgi:CDP-diglyceride synthetase
MGGMTGGGMPAGGMSMGGALLPDWLGWIGFAVYIVILLIHLYHMATMKGQHRAWHTGHSLMALGMAWMFLPKHPIDIPAVVWQIAFAVAACLVAAWCIWNWSQRRAVNFLWATLLIGVLAMIYMYAFPGAANRSLTYVLVVYFALEAIAWFTGAFAGTEKERRWRLPYALGPRASSAYPLAEAGALDIRLTLGLMALGMGYMFLAMQIAL